MRSAEEGRLVFPYLTRTIRMMSTTGIRGQANCYSVGEVISPATTTSARPSCELTALYPGPRVAHIE